MMGLLFPKCRAASVTLGLALLVLSVPTARAYDPATTHAGMSDRATQHEHLLHRWLVQVHGLPLGAFEPLRLEESLLPLALRDSLTRHLGELDPVHGYRPDENLRNRAGAWLVAGTVLEGMPFTRARHHFLDPVTGRGLRNAADRRFEALRLRFLDFSDGEGALGGIFTGANFDLTGKSVLVWARHPDNGYNLRAHFQHRLAALTAATPRERSHHLAMTLITTGALLHLLQQMAVPALVRNDFVASYLAPRSNLRMDLASAYETLVRRRYGRSGISPLAPRATLPSHARFDDFFSNKARTGLANQTNAGFFSLGSLPKPRVMQESDTEASLTNALRQSMPYAAPAVGHLHLRRSARTGSGYYYGTTENPYLFAYRVTPQGSVDVTMDDRCHEAAAERLVPAAVRHSAGLLAFLLRGELKVQPDGDRRQLMVTHTGPGLAKGRLILLWEDSQGRRTALRTVPVPARKTPLRPGDRLATLDLGAVPSSARRILVAFEGLDEALEPLVLGATLTSK